MATYSAIASVSRAMLGLIELQCPPELLANPEFKLYHAPDFEKPMSEGFSLFLYRLLDENGLGFADAPNFLGA